MDKYLVSLAILLLFLEGMWLAHDLDPSSFNFSSSQIQGMAVGKIVKHKSQVRKRAQDSLIWEDTSLEQSLFAYDSILTLNESAAEIELRGDSRISLNENTMVVIEPPPNGRADGPLRLRFKRGSLRTTTGKNSQAIEANDFVIEATPNTKMNLRSKNNNFEVETLSGEVRILDSKTLKVAELIKNGENAQVSPKGIARSPAATGLEWLRPVDNERIYTHGPSAAVTFEWLGEVTAIEINDESFEVNSKELNKTLPLGNYNIKLHAQNSVSLAKSLHVWQAPKIYSISPSQNQRFKKADEISFLWSQTNGVSEYELQISQDPKFFNDVKTFLSEEVGMTIPDLSSGHWYWRVRGKDDSGFTVPELYHGEFFILEKPLGAPKVKQPRIKKGARLEKHWLRQLWELILPAAEAAPRTYFAEFQWDKLEGAKGYTIEISAEPDFRNLILSSHVKNESFKWKNFKLGRYYWRVAGEDSDGQLGLYSDAALADLTQIPTEPITANYMAPKPKLEPPKPVEAKPPPPPLPPPQEEETTESLPWKYDFELGAHGAYSKFLGSDFTAQNLGLVVGDFRFTLTPPINFKFKHWKSETELHLFALRARPESQFPFQDLITGFSFRQIFIKEEKWGVGINQFLLYKRGDLERLTFDNLWAAGPVYQYNSHIRTGFYIGQTYALDFSYLHQFEKPWTPTRDWIFSLEGRGALGLTMNRNFWYDTGAYLWIGVRWK